MAVVVSIPRDARVSLPGDSTVSANGGAGGAVANYPPMVGFVNAKRIADGGGADVGSPVYYVSGEAGDNIADVTAAGAARIYKYNPTIIIVPGLGINDAINGHTPTQIQNDTTAFINACRSNCPLLQGIIWGLPWLVGDRWPSGANTADGFDAAIDTAVATMAAVCASLGVQSIDVRAATMALLPTLNPSNVRGGSGLVVDNGGDASCKHPTPAGALVHSQIMYGGLVFAP